MNNQSFMSPDRVLSLVVLVLSVLMILSSASLHYVQSEMSYTGAMIGKISDQTVEQIRMQRQWAEVLGEVSESEGDEMSTEEIVEE